jgi:hypothetical protein
VNENNTTKSKRHQVFVSYAQADSSIAHKVAEALRGARLRVWIDAWELASGDSIAQRIQDAASSSDFLLVLLSPRSVSSKWVQNELNAALSKELRDRAITVIPVLIDDCDIPPLLADRVFFDLSRDFPEAMQRLVNQIRSAPDVDFSRLDGETFVKVVIDLLARLGFSVQNTPIASGSEFDLIATFRSHDPFGTEETNTWLVETKLYRNERVSVSALRKMLTYLMPSCGNKKGLIITNSRLTSVAREFLSENIGGSGSQLRVIDGTELTNLLIKYPDLIQAYFPSGDIHE